MSGLEIRGLQVSVNTDDGSVEILKGVDLTIKPTQGFPICFRLSCDERLGSCPIGLAT